LRVTEPLQSKAYHEVYLTSGWDENGLLVATSNGTPLTDIIIMEEVEGHMPDLPSFRSTRYHRFTLLGRVAA